MTFANNFHEPPAGVTGARRQGAAVGPARRGDAQFGRATAAPGPGGREIYFAEQGTFAR